MDDLTKRIMDSISQSTWCYLPPDNKPQSSVYPKEKCKCVCEGKDKSLCQGGLDAERFHKRYQELSGFTTEDYANGVTPYSMIPRSEILEILDKEFEDSDWYKNNVVGAFGDSSPKEY